MLDVHLLTLQHEAPAWGGRGTDGLAAQFPADYMHHARQRRESGAAGREQHIQHREPCKSYFIHTPVLHLSGPKGSDTVALLGNVVNQNEIRGDNWLDFIARV